MSTATLFIMKLLLIVLVGGNMGEFVFVLIPVLNKYS